MRVWVLVVIAACSGKKAPPPAADAAIVSVRPVVDAPVEAVVVTPDAAVDPVRPEHVAYDLVDNRHAAHRIVNGDLVLDASTVGFARYTRFGMPSPRWGLGKTVDGKRVAVPDKIAGLEVPLTVEQARTSRQVTVRMYAAVELELSVKVNGGKASKDPRVELVPGWQTVAIAVDEKRFAVGENQLALEWTRRGADKRKKLDKGVVPLAVEWVRIGDPRPVTDEDPRTLSSFDVAAHSISIAKDASLTWFVSLPDGANLVANVAAPCVIDVRARPSADAFAGGVLDATRDRVDLTKMGGKVVALSLTVRDCPLATITQPRITLHGQAATPLAKAPPPKYIVLWVMDALRAGSIPTFTPGARAQTPNFDELAKTSAVFRQYYVQGNESQTSHSSVWTGVYPAVHNVRLAGEGGNWAIPDKLAVIAEQATDAGYVTTAVTGNGFVTKDGGYTRGFSEFRNMMREKGEDVINGVIYGEKIVDAALGQLDKVRAQPTYLFLGTIDTHGPWIARKPWIDIYSPGRYDGPFVHFGTSKELGFLPGRMGCSIIPPPADIERLRAIYDSAVSYQDQQLGRFVEQLRTWGIWDQTMLIVTADHGEEFFEDTRCGHGGSLRETLVRVPLLIHDPSRFPGGTIIDEGAEGVDLFPTIAEALGKPAPAQIQGASLVGLAQGQGKGWPSPSYVSMYEYAHGMRIGRWKIRVGKTGVPVIGDLLEDPGEQREVSAARPVERRMLTDALGLFLAMRAQWRKDAWGHVTAITAAGAAALDGASVR